MKYTIPQPLLDDGPGVFPYTVDGEKVYVKKRRPEKNPLAWHAQRVLYALTRLMLVLPPERPPRNGARFEAEALRRMEALGVPAPRLLHVTDEYLVMTDAGVTLEEAMRDHPDQARPLTEKAVRALRDFHNLGLAHGGAQIKNITVKDGAIHFIDFEESIPQKHLAKFQIRDLFLFILSLERTGHDPDLAEICAAYDGAAGKGTLAAVRKALLQLRGVRLAEHRLFSSLSMRDVRGLCRLVGKARETAAEGCA